MASQAYLTDMQAVNVTALQQSSGTSLAIGSSNHKSVKSHAVLQPAQNSYPGQQFIVTIASDNGSDAENLDLQHTGGQHIIYQSHQGYDYSQNAMYTSGSAPYYQTSGQISGGVHGQTITHGGEMYLMPGGIRPVDSDSVGLTHTIRASPATVQWLVDNYETAEGVSLPRSTLYNHYLRHCQENKLDPMNPASFGKLIRSVFLGLRTRRLGTRGNSQYHYYGIRIKPSSFLPHPSDGLMTPRSNAINPAKRFKTDGSDASVGDGSNPCGQPTSVTAGTAVGAADGLAAEHQQYLDMSAALPNFGSIGIRPDQLPPGVTMDHVAVFETMYRDHCEAFLEIVFNLQFPLIETLWQSFWRNAPQTELDCDEYDQRLPKDHLYALCELAIVRQYVCQADYAFYQAVVQVLIPDVLRPIPSLLTQMIRNFAKNLEGWLKNAMTGVPDEMIKAKTSAVSAFAQILRRYTSLNHLAQAARAVLTNGNQITQMLADINKVDFANVQEQASWVCQCDDSIVRHLEQDFKRTLQQQTPLEQWAAWLEGVVNQALGPYESSPDLPKAARQFLLKWSFYSSMVIRDLTLRSAASFGSFHLIRLLYDEYMFYLVEHKVAAATGETSIAVMGDFRQAIDIDARLPLGFSHQDDVGSPQVLSTSQSAVGATLQAYSTPPPASVTNGPAMINGNSSFPVTTAASGATNGGVSFRDLVVHARSTQGVVTQATPMPAHRVILTTAASSSSAAATVLRSQTIVVMSSSNSGSGASMVPSHSAE